MLTKFHSLSHDCQQVNLHRCSLNREFGYKFTQKNSKSMFVKQKRGNCESKNVLDLIILANSAFFIPVC